MPPSLLPLMDICPACNRFTGQQLECPYCGLDSPSQPLQRALRLAAITLGIAGLATLLFIGRQSTPPVIPISRLRPVMNHGYVTLAGTVVAEPRIHRTATAPKTISFDLSDGSGKVTVMTTPAAAKDLLIQDCLPSPHQALEITGHLYLAAGRPARLYVDSAQSLIRNLNTAHPANAGFPLHEE